MNTSGRGNDALIILVPLGVLVAVGMILFGGPMETLHVMNMVVADTARVTMQVLRALLS